MSLPEWAKWMARDNDGTLWTYDNKPERYEEIGEWYLPAEVGKFDYIDYLSESNFPHIKWSDDEPTEIINTTINNTQVGDPVNHPSHYNQGGIETLDLIKLYLTPEEYEGYLKGNIIKYRERAQFKGNAEQDYAKAKFYYDEASK